MAREMYCFEFYSFARELTSMMIIVGQRLCGRVDQVPGICYVATRFLHFYYVPLIPLSSWVIVQGSEGASGFRGQQIRLSLKSVVFGWLQAFFVVFGLVHSIWGGILLAEQNRAANNGFDGMVKLSLGLSCLVAWLVFTIRPFQAGQERADELLAHLGMEPVMHDEKTN